MDQFGGITGEEAMRNAERNLAALREAMANPQPAVSNVDELVAFLRAALDHDERLAREAPGPVWHRAIEREGEPGRWRGIKAELVTLPPEWPKHEPWVGATVVSSTDRRVAEHIARWDPARVLAEVQAKRELLDHVLSWLDVDDEFDEVQTAFRAESVPVLRLLAQPYAGQPGWREEWQLSASS